jgi:hypothetical protein
MERAALALTCALAVVASVATSGQAPDPRAPLERYLGTWVYEGDGNGARVTCRSERRWIANRSFVESHRECSTVNGPITNVELYGFDARRGVYVYWGFNGPVPSTYTATTMALAVAWSGEQMSGNNRCHETFAPDFQSSTSQCEISFDLGKTWQRVSGGASKRLPP